MEQKDGFQASFMYGRLKGEERQKILKQISVLQDYHIVLDDGK